MSTPNPEDKLINAIPVFAPHIERMKVRNMDPNFHYRWVTLDQDRIDFVREQFGYEFVQDDTEASADGRRIVGNSVLMRCPKEMYEAREHIRRLRSRQMLEAPRSKVKSTAESLGLEAQDQTREYRAPLMTGMEEPADRSEKREGTITREQAKQFNPNVKE